MTITLANEPQELAPGGFVALDLAAEAALELDADRPLVLFEHNGGPGWTTLTAPSPFQDPTLILPHLPPSSSPWLTQLALTNAGSLEAQVSGSNLSGQTIPLGLSEFSLRGEADHPSDLKLKGGLDPETTPFAESSLSGQQYWTLNNFYAAERAGLKPSQSLYLPHVPNLNEWWLGIVLTNPGDQSITITLSAYDAEGKLLPSNWLELEPHSSKIGVLSDFYTDQTVTPAWLHLQAEISGFFTSEFMGIAFIGNKTDPTADVACYALPGQAAQAQALPGAISEDWYGLAIVNPDAVQNLIRVEAVAGDGSVLASLERELGPRAKTLIVGQESFPNLTGRYYLRLRSESGRLLGVQLNGPALSLQGGEALP